jgi:hypothetical protein
MTPSRRTQSAQWQSLSDHGCPVALRLGPGGTGEGSKNRRSNPYASRIPFSGQDKAASGQGLSRDDFG